VEDHVFGVVSFTFQSGKGRLVVASKFLTETKRMVMKTDCSAEVVLLADK
jgi:hypothetical protein